MHVLHEWKHWTLTDKLYCNYYFDIVQSLDAECLPYIMMVFWALSKEPDTWVLRQQYFLNTTTYDSTWQKTNKIKQNISHHSQSNGKERFLKTKIILDMNENEFTNFLDMQCFCKTKWIKPFCFVYLLHLCSWVG